MTLTETGLSKQAQRFIDSLAHATYELDGVTKTVNLFKTSVEGSTVKVYVYFDDSIAGEVKNVKLVDKDGDIVAHADRAFSKPLIKGLYVAFKYKFVEMEVENFAAL